MSGESSCVVLCCPVLCCAVPCQRHATHAREGEKVADKVRRSLQKTDCRSSCWTTWVCGEWRPWSAAPWAACSCSSTHSWAPTTCAASCPLPRPRATALGASAGARRSGRASTAIQSTVSLLPPAAFLVCPSLAFVSPPSSTTLPHTFFSFAKFSLLLCFKHSTH